MTVASATADVRKLDMGAVIRETSELIGGNFRSLALPVAALGVIPRMVVLLLNFNTLSSPARINSGVSFGIVGLSAGVLLEAIMIQVLIASLRGRKITAVEGYHRATDRLWPLFLTSLAVGLLTLVGLVLLIVPGAMLGVRWILASPASVIERKGVGEAMARSRDLTKGNRWSIFGLLVVFLILDIVVELAAQFGAGLIWGNGAPVQKILAGLLLGVVGGSTVAVMMAWIVALYWRLVMLKEGAPGETIAEVFS